MITPKQGQLLLKIARETLENYLKNSCFPNFIIKDKNLNKKRGVFVTLKINDSLRGCIGSLVSSNPLYKEVQKRVIDAALNDPRFSPLVLEEVKKVRIEISVLSSLKKIKNWQEIILGKHGVFLKRGGRGGTFLPQVAKETGWDLETFLSNLCFYKAGLEPDCYKNPQTEIFVFTVQVFQENFFPS